MGIFYISKLISKKIFIRKMLATGCKDGNLKIFEINNNDLIQKHLMKG